VDGRRANSMDSLPRGGRRAARRRGLSTVEMVLSLPILLFLMGLMINFGTAASWKVRGLSVARHAACSSRWPRTIANQPRPDSWPAAASVAAGTAADASALDDPRADHAVVRGPSLPLGTRVRRELLDPARGMLAGTSRIERPHTLLKSLGNLALSSRAELLDDKWQFERTGQPVNLWRRIPALYELARAPAGYVRDYARAVAALLHDPLRSDLDPLDRDDEFIGYSRRFGWGTAATDFHPLLARFCTLDKSEAQRRVRDLIDRIQGKQTPRVPSVAAVMAQGFIDLYERAMAALRARGGGLPSGASGAVLAEIADLQRKIDALRRLQAAQD